MLNATVHSFSSLNNNRKDILKYIYPFSWWRALSCFQDLLLQTVAVLLWTFVYTPLGARMREWKCWVTGIKSSFNLTSGDCIDLYPISSKKDPDALQPLVQSDILSDFLIFANPYGCWNGRSFWSWFYFLIVVEHFFSDKSVHITCPLFLTDFFIVFFLLICKSF